MVVDRYSNQSERANWDIYDDFNVTKKSFFSYIRHSYRWLKILIS